MVSISNDVAPAIGKKVDSHRSQQSEAQAIEATVSAIKNLNRQNPLFPFKDALLSEFREQMSGVRGIRQGGKTSVCAAASLQSVVLHENKRMYAVMVRELVTSGVALKGLVKFVPGSELTDDSMKESEFGVLPRGHLDKVIQSSLMELINGEALKFDPRSGSSIGIVNNKKLEIQGSFDSWVNSAYNRITGEKRTVEYIERSNRVNIQHAFENGSLNNTTVSIRLDPNDLYNHQITIDSFKDGRVFLRDSGMTAEMPDLFKSFGARFENQEKGLWSVPIGSLLGSDDSQGLLRYVLMQSANGALTASEDKSLAIFNSSSTRVSDSAEIIVIQPGYDLDVLCLAYIKLHERKSTKKG